MPKETKLGCIIEAVSTGLVVAGLIGLVSQMSWENYEENMRREALKSQEPYKPPQQRNPRTRQYTPPPTARPPQPMYPTPTPIPSLHEAPLSDDSCAEYPPGVNHWDQVCVDGTCGAKFFGRRGWGIETSWYVQWFDEEGRPHRVDCTQIPRSSVIPDPNN